MSAEYRYLMLVAGWVLLWTFMPFIALPLFIIVMVRHFSAIRQQRKVQQHVKALHRNDQHWSRMEGFQQPQDDPADWWKR